MKKIIEHASGTFNVILTRNQVEQLVQELSQRLKRNKDSYLFPVSLVSYDSDVIDNSPTEPKMR